MKFKYAYKRTTTKNTPLLPGMFALVFTEDPNGKTLTELANKLTEVNKISDNMMDCLLRKIPYVMEFDSEVTDEDLEDIKKGISIIDTVSLVTRAKMEKGGKKPAQIALEKIMTFGVFRNVESMANHELLMQFNFLCFDVSKYSTEDLRKKVFKLAVPLQQGANANWIISTDFANNMSMDEQFDRQVISRLPTCSFLAEKKGLDNPYVRAL